MGNIGLGPAVFAYDKTLNVSESRATGSPSCQPGNPSLNYRLHEAADRSSDHPGSASYPVESRGLRPLARLGARLSCCRSRRPHHIPFRYGWPSGPPPGNGPQGQPTGAVPLRRHLPRRSTAGCPGYTGHRGCPGGSVRIGASSSGWCRFHHSLAHPALRTRPSLAGLK